MSSILPVVAPVAPVVAPVAHILSFDVGILNMAFCQMTMNHGPIQDKATITGWDTINLVASQTPIKKEKPKCSSCKLKASYIITSTQLIYCPKHTPMPPLQDLSGNRLTKIPPITVMKPLLVSKDLVAAKSCKKKEDYITQLSKHFAMPIEQEKTVKTKHLDVALIRDAIHEVVLKNKTLWSQATEIRIENQPVFTNPQMKTVQMLLYSALFYVLDSRPRPLRLVHASIKSKGAMKGDAGKSDRKALTIKMTDTFLASSSCLDPNNLAKVFHEGGKKAGRSGESVRMDLADSFIMCLRGFFDSPASSDPS